MKISTRTLRYTLIKTIIRIFADVGNKGAIQNGLKF